MDTKSLKNLFIFQLLTAEEVETLAPFIAEKRVKAGEVIFKEGEPGEVMDVIQAGSVDLTLEGKKSLGSIKVGDFFGEIGLFEKVLRTATITATTDCVLYEIRRDDFARLISSNPTIGNKIMFRIIQRMASRQRAMNVQL